MDDNVSVLIVGGGPAGLTAALLLARQGITSLLVERHTGTSIHPRARGLNVRTMEIYRTLGLEPAIRSAGAALEQSRYMLFVETLAGREVRRVADDELTLTGDALAEWTPCGWCQCAQDELEPILLAAAREHGAIVQFDTELVELSQDNDGVRATLRERRGGMQRTVRAHYVIAADGAQSGLRAALDVPFVGQGEIEYFINIYFRADLSALVEDRWFGICFVENPAVEGLFLAVNNRDRWLFNVSYDQSSGTRPEDFTAERCVELVRQAVGLAALEVEIISALPWAATARLAEQFQVGRVLLAGDAAHVMPPAGGFGLNMAVQDAHNLAWKLACVLRGTATPALLTSYAAERQPIAQEIIDLAVRELTAETPDTPGGYGPPDSAPPDSWDGAGPPAGPPGEAWDGEGPPGGADALSYQLAAVLGYRYRSDAIVGAVDDFAPRQALELSGAPGTRAPHLWVERAGQTISLLDLFERSFVLLTGPQGTAWLAAAQAVAAQMPLELAAYSVGPAGDLVDREGRWLAAYGVDDGGAVLVRPDGFVGWRSATLVEQPAQALTEALTLLLGHGATT